MTESKPPVGEVVKRTQSGELPIGTTQQILTAAPGDIKKEVVPIPEWGYSVRLQSFTASESARIRQMGIAIREGETAVAWAEMEIMQFELGCKEPQFTNEEVRQLHLTSGAGFARVIKWLDENSGLDKEAIRKARDEFLGSNERKAVSPPVGPGPESDGGGGTPGS